MRLIFVLFAVVLFSSPVFAWSWAGAASTMQGYDQAERQRLSDEAAARKQQMDQWRFEQEKKQHEEAERVKAKKIADENASTEVQKLIDLNPTLKNWQQNDPEKWKQAIEYDDFLRVSDKYKNLSMADRFNEVVRVLSAKFEDEEKSDANHQSEQWVRVGYTSGEIKSFYYLHKQKIHIEKNTRYAWALTNYSKVATDNGLSYNQTKTSWAVNCEKKKMGIKQTTYFLRNEVVKSLDLIDKPQMNEVVPDSIGEAMLQMICAYKK